MRAKYNKAAELISRANRLASVRWKESIRIFRPKSVWKWTPDDSTIISMVSLARVATEKEGDAEPKIIHTFKLVPGPPAGCSYASEIASCYGISYDRLLQILRNRGLVR